MFLTMLPSQSTQNIRKPSPLAYKRRFGKKGVWTYAKRALVVGLYLPLLILLRWIFTAARFHGDARSIEVTHTTIEFSQLPTAFDGLKIVFLTDFHCSPLTPPAFLERVIEKVNQLEPDLILLGGDYISEGTDFIQPIETLLACLDAPLGVYGVLGNHDFDADVCAVRTALQRAGIVELTNTNIWLTRADSRICIAGVGDLWEDAQDIHAALQGAVKGDMVILLSHNPDFVMELDDARVCLVLSGHTHGGQIHLPGIGPLINNSRYGRRLSSGLISFSSFQLYVSRGLGTVMVPFRYHCAPEIVLLTLRQAQD
jgi:hypothetical protein